MILLIDTNILLDVLLEREPYNDASALIWKFCETDILSGNVSSLSIANIVYIMRKELNPEKIEEVLRSLKLIFSFTNLSEADLINAARLKWSDFEDAVQSVIAERIGAEYIITRNVQDFGNSKVPAITPTKFIDTIYLSENDKKE